MESGLKTWRPQLFLLTTQWEVLQLLSKTQFSILLSLKRKDGASSPNLSTARTTLSPHIYRCTMSSCICEELLKSRHFAEEESAFIGLETDITVMRTREQCPRKSLSVFHLFLGESLVLFCLLKNSQNHQCLSQDEYFNLSSFLFFHSCCMRNFTPRNSSFPHQFWSVLKLNLSQRQQSLNRTLPCRD